MNILKNIKKKIEIVKDYNDIEGLESVVIHVERAEMFLNEGQNKNEDHYYTDAIYRTNHAFEGILKEAYFILTERDASKKSPFEIETFFNSENIFKERVLDLFRNYRKSWRNPSTHDHKLFFSRNEAFLAIISVSSFIYILLDQILEELSFKNYKISKEKEISSIKESLTINRNMDLLNQIKEFLLKFYYNNFGRKNSFSVESELFGALKAHLVSLGGIFKISHQPILLNDKNRRIRPDFLIRKNGEQLIIEVKVQYNRSSIKSGIEQLKSYFKVSGLNQGILFFSQPSKGPIRYESKIIIDGDCKIIIISPESNQNFN